MRTKVGETWIDPEELAYDVPLYDSPRKCRAICPDGKLRIVVCGVPDTYFSIPARLVYKHKTVQGFVSSCEEGFSFTPYANKKNGGIFNNGSQNE